MARTLIHRRRKGDRAPALTLQALDLAGDPLDITGATTPVFSMRLLGATTNTVDRATATIVDASTGTIRYSWAAVDVDTSGTYLAEFEVSLSGLPLTIPGDDQELHVVITDDLG